MCQCISFLVCYVIVKTCYHDCRRVLLRLCGRLRSCQRHFVSPEVNLFRAARLQNRDFRRHADHLAYFRSCRRMGACFSVGRPLARGKISLQKAGKLRGNPNTLSVSRKREARNAREKPRYDTLKGASKRRYTNGASDIACLYTQQGHKGTNQDAMIVWEGCGTVGDMIFCGVFDGHGPFGHLVAQNVRDSLPSKLVSSWQAIKRVTMEVVLDKVENGPNKGSEQVEAEDRLSDESDAVSYWKQLFLNCYKSMDKELQMNPSVDCCFSGTTAVTLIKQGYDLVVGNVGDSRAVLGTKSDDGSIVAVQLTVDLKPNLPQEAERIRQCKGRVFALQDEPEVHRVWLPLDNSPGLAMARALGDFCLKNFGVIAVPEVTYRRLTERDQFIVLATDGIWDVLSNEQVVKIVSSISARQMAARAVVDTAVHVWRSMYPTSKVDDCAVVCLYVDDVSNASFLSATKQSELHQARSQSLDSELVIKESKSGQNPSWQNAVDHVDKGSKNIAAADSAQGSSFEGVVDEWLALEGVTRVNSLVNLPRFCTEDKRGV